MQRAAARPGETALVHGASGGVGLAAVQMCHAAGMTVVGTAGTDAGRKLVKDNGADQVLDHKQPGYLALLMQSTSGRGFDVILEMLANQNLASDLTLLAPRGRVLVIGSRGPVEINPRDAMVREAEIRAMSLFNATEAELASVHAALIAGLENQTLRPVIGREFPLAEASRAHEALMQPGASGKIVLTV